MRVVSGVSGRGLIGACCVAFVLTGCGGSDDSPAPVVDTGGNGGGSTVASDVQDGATVGSATVLASFKDGVTGWSVLDTSGSASDKLATISLDAKSALATEGVNAAKVVVSGAATQAYISSTPQTADWTGKRYLKVDMAATSGVWYVKLATKSGKDWVWCDVGQDGPSKADANAAKTAAATVTFDLSAMTCYGGSYTASDVKQLMLWVDGNGGTYTIDNIRLEADGGTPAASDAADGSVVGNELVLFSFKSDVAAFAPYDSSGNAAATMATVTLDANSALATQGVNAAKVSVPGAADKGYVGGAPSVADWSAYRYFKADMAATGGIWYAKLATKSGKDWVWCDLGGDGPTKLDAAGKAGKDAMATVTFDLSALTCYGGSLTKSDVKHFMLWVEGSGGSYTIDNVRLSN